jgi:uncharacterized protein YodC (DUF2158 family)
MIARTTLYPDDDILIGANSRISIGRFSNVIRALGYESVRSLSALSESIAYSSGQVFYSISPSAFFAITNIMNYYYMSPHGQIYRFAGTKGVTDCGPGTLYVSRGTVGIPENVALYSQFSGLTNLMQSGAASFSFTITSDNASVTFNFGSNSFTITGSTLIIKTVSTVSYASTTLMIGAQTINGIEQVLLVGEGVESYAAAQTAFSSYNSYLISGKIAVFSTSSVLTAMIESAQVFLGSGGIPQDTFDISGNTIRYAGVEVLTLTSGTGTDVTALGVTYQRQILNYGPTLSGTSLFAFNSSNVNVGFAINSLEGAIGSNNAVVYSNGGRAFLTNDQSLISDIASAFMTQTITRSTASYNIVTQNGDNFFQINGMTIIRIENAGMSLLDGDTVQFMSGMLSLVPSNGRGPFAVSRLTVINTGQSDIEIIPSTISRSFNVNSGYMLFRSGSNALLLNDGSVQTLLRNNQLSVTTVTNSMGQSVLTIGGSSAFIIDRSVVTRSVPSGSSVTLNNGFLSGIDGGGRAIFNFAASSVSTYLQNQNAVGSLTNGMSLNGPVTVFSRGTEVFITDRTNVNTLITDTIASIPSTSVVSPSPSVVSSSSMVSPGPAPTTTLPLPTITPVPSSSPILVDGTDVIVLSGSSQRTISSGQSVQFSNNMISILNVAGALVEQFSNIRRLSLYRNTDPSLRSFISNTELSFQGTGGSLVINQLSGDAFYTDRPDLVRQIQSFMQPDDIGIFTSPTGMSSLMFAGFNLVSLTNGVRGFIGPGMIISISKDGYSIFTGDSEVATVRQPINRIIRYLNNMAVPTITDVTDGIDPPRFTGPVDVIFDGDSVFVTNRSNVTNLVNSVNPVVFRPVNNQTVLEINGMNVITVTGAMINLIGSHEFVTYDASDLAITNGVTLAQNMFGRTFPSLFVFTDQSDVPMRFDGSAPGRFFGPGILVRNDDDALLVTREDLINSIFRIIMTPSQPRPPVPEPGGGNIITDPTQLVLITNPDGTSWTIPVCSTCSRSCGGVQVCIVECEDSNGVKSTVCTDPLQPTSVNIPALINLCGASCPGSTNATSTIPQNHTAFDVIIGSPGDLSAVGTVTVTSNADDDIFTVIFNATSVASGSSYRIVSERVNGATMQYSQIDLRQNFVPIMVDTTVSSGNVISVQHGDNVFRVDLMSRNGQPADECVDFRMLTYSDESLMFDSRMIPNIRRVSRLDHQRLAQYFGAFNLAGESDGYLCINFVTGEAFYTRNSTFIGLIQGTYDGVIATLRGPAISPGDPAPSDVVRVTDQVFQVGTSPISVLEEINKISIRCRLDDVGNPPVTMYMWQKDNENIVSDNVNYVIDGDVLLIRNTDRASDGGKYTCIVHNGVASDNSSTELMVVEEVVATMMPTVPTSPPPSNPMWVSGSYTDCHKRCNVGVQVRDVLCLLNGQASTACNASEVPSSFRFCNIQDCPDIGGGSRNGIPLNENITFSLEVPSGTFDTIVNITSTSNVTRSYNLALTARYPDATLIMETSIRMNAQIPSQTTSVTFGAAELGRVQVFRTLNRIDIFRSQAVFSVIPELGDICYEFNNTEHFIYSSGVILSSSLPDTISNINSLLSLNRSTEWFYNRADTQLFQGPRVLCVSPFYGRAFVTNIPVVSDELLQGYRSIDSEILTPPVISPSNLSIELSGTEKVRSIILGDSISATDGSYITINVVMDQPGLPTPQDLEWRREGQRIETDYSKNQIISRNGYMLILSNLGPNHAGVYEFIIKNSKGSDSATTSITYRPNDFGIIVRQPAPSENNNVLNVGIGLNYLNIPVGMITSVTLFCPVNDVSSGVVYRYMKNGALIATETEDKQNDTLVGNESTIMYTCTAINGTNAADTDIRTSVVQFATPSSPNITIVGRTILNAGEFALLTCTATGLPVPSVRFDTIIPGPDGMVSPFTIFPNGSLAIFDAKPNDMTMYCCGAVNSLGRTDRCASIMVRIPPTITDVSEMFSNVPLPLGVMMPTDDVMIHIGQAASVAQGSNIIIACNSTASPMAQYEWFLDNVQLAETTNMLTVLNINEDGTYRCRAFNMFGEDSAESEITVLRPPNVVDSSMNVPNITMNGVTVAVNQMSNLIVRDGVNFCIDCITDNNEVPNNTVINWIRNNEGVDVADICISFDDTRLCFTQISRPYSGLYSCVVVNDAGSDSGSINITVATAPTIRFPVHSLLPADGFCDNQESKLFVNEDVGVHLCLTTGTRVLLDCEVSSDSIPSAEVFWTNNNGRIDSSTTGFNVFPNNSLLINSATNDTYNCTAFNLQGQASRSSTITVTQENVVIDTRFINGFTGLRRIVSVRPDSPMFTVDLQLFNETLVLCNARGRPTPEISWRIGDSPVNEAINPDLRAAVVQDDGSLLIRGLSSTACALYTCTASSVAGVDVHSATICGRRYDCFESGLSPCSVTCGFGVQNNLFSCNRTVDDDTIILNSVNDVPSALRPDPGFSSCQAVTACPIDEYRYEATDFSQCSCTCGGGNRTRSVECYLYKGEVRDMRVDINFCLAFANSSLFPSPLSEACNTYPCPDWIVSDYTECDSECDYGNQTRNTSCISPFIDNAVVDRRLCNAETEPETRLLCINRHCQFVYRFGPYGDCTSSCLGGIRERRVFCYDAFHKLEVADSFCDERNVPRPPSINNCGFGACPKRYHWIVGAYGRCNQTCGDGAFRKRTIQCQDVVTQTEVDDTRCLHAKPATEESCNLPRCPGAACTSESFLCRLVNLNPGVFCPVVSPNLCCTSC